MEECTVCTYYTDEQTDNILYSKLYSILLIQMLDFYYYY